MELVARRMAVKTFVSEAHRPVSPLFDCSLRTPGASPFSEARAALHGGPVELHAIGSPVSTKEDAMSYRLLTAVLITAGALFATQSIAETTVKSSKSNSSDRMGGGGGGKGAAGVTAVKSSKSNSSDRMGGGGGGKGAMRLNPQPEPPGRR
jgi:hypothetical protein